MYYVAPGKGKYTSFKPVSAVKANLNGNSADSSKGFRMLTGDAGQHAKVGSGKLSQSCYRCYNDTNYGGDLAAPCQDKKYYAQPF